MDTMNIALPSDMKDFIQNEVTIGGFSSTSEYIRSLVREEQRRKEEKRMELLLLEGLNSGPSKEMTKEDWNALKQRVLNKKSER